MKQTCNVEYWHGMEKMKPDEAPCGKTFEDVEQNTHCPHDPLPPKLTDAQLDRLWEQVIGPDPDE